MSHHPPHILINESWYMLTAATLGKRPYLSSNRAKLFLCNKLKELVIIYQIVLRAWVILDNHYHILFKASDAQVVPRLIGKLHGSTAFQFNQWDDKRGRQIWHNYWDTLIRSERDYWLRFNYIHWNPIKHSYVERLEDWPFSSYQYYLRSKGQEFLDDCFRQYPVRAELLNGDDFS